MNILQEFDTITAIATPLGIGGVGVIRISGEKSFDIISKISSKKNLAIGKINHGWIIDNEKKIDEVIFLLFQAPNSFTGENVVEIQCHGGINVIRNILDLVLKNGARMAERGEFTKRAFMNKKIDLSQAEAVCDIIHSKTQNFAIHSAKNLSGTLSKKISEIKKNIFDILSKIIAGIDFPEDVAEPSYEFIEEEIKKSITSIEEILTYAKSSNIMRQGLKIAILGRPNVGKSSLFNALLNLNRAIVTDIAGTTRDAIMETLDFDGIPITLIDTAGIRNADNKVEKIGVEYSKQFAQEADLIIFITNANEKLNDEDFEILDIIKDKNVIKIANKTDLLDDLTKIDKDYLPISILSEKGLDNLKSQIKLKINNNTEDIEFITNTRQQNCLINAINALKNALITTQNNELQDLISIDIKSALLALDEITGEVITDDILNNIFEHFCIGK